MPVCMPTYILAYISICLSVYLYLYIIISMARQDRPSILPFIHTFYSYPMHCSYCTTNTHITLCLDCQQAFCNTFLGTTTSHIVFHLKKHGHTRISVGQPVVCRQCRCEDVFVLRMGCDGIVCDECAGDRHGDRVIDGKAVHTLLYTNASTDVPMDVPTDVSIDMPEDTSRDASGNALRNTSEDALRNASENKSEDTSRNASGNASESTFDGIVLPGTARKDVPSSQEARLPHVQLTYTHKEYIRIFKALITAECEQERVNKERLAQERIFVRFEHGNGRTYAHFSMCRDVGVRINIGDEIEVTSGENVCRGFICNESVHTSENVGEIVWYRHVPVTGEYRMTFPWRNVGYQRMVYALKHLRKRCSRRIVQTILHGTDRHSRGRRSDAVVLSGTDKHSRGRRSDTVVSSDADRHSHGSTRGKRSDTVVLPDMDNRGSTRSRRSDTVVVPPGMPCLNASQQTAIRAALSNPLTLIQGPPGTGKTITTAAIVHNLLQHRHGRILVVAPSNIAVDNLARRMLRCNIDVLRIVSRNREGLESDLDEITLHKLVEKAVRDGHGNEKEQAGDVQCMVGLTGNEKGHVNEDKTKQTGDESKTRQTADENRKGHGNESKRGHANESKKGHGSKRGQSGRHAKGRQDSVTDRMSRLSISRTDSRIRTTLIKKARVVTCTCVTAGQELLRHFRFPYVLIDEAVQATEPLTLVPLVYSCRKLVLVGDHKQLGPTILNRQASDAGLRVSLFERLVRLGIVPYMLTVQYRMHPVLCEWVSNTFYDGALVSVGDPACSTGSTAGSTANAYGNGKTYTDDRMSGTAGNIASSIASAYGMSKTSGTGKTYADDRMSGTACSTASAYGIGKTSGTGSAYGMGKYVVMDWFNVAIPTFYYVCDGKEEVFISGTSFLNRKEARQCLAIVHHLTSRHVRECDIGIITPYEGQRVLLSRLTSCEVANVDAFQGREKAFIIISLVRSNANSDIGFVSDRRRMCVALTRAKHGLFIVGNPGTFNKSRLWMSLVRYYEEKGVLVEGEIGRLRRCAIGGNDFDISEYIMDYVKNG